VLQSRWVFWESVLFFNSLCTNYSAVFCKYVKLYFILFFSDGGKVIVYVVSCPKEGCQIALLLDSGCFHSVVLFVHFMKKNYFQIMIQLN
jgi:hypothetical protein